MISNKRTSRLNSLLKQVIWEVIQKDVKNPYIDKLLSVTEVKVSRDLRHATVYISLVNPTEESKKQTMKSLRSASNFISVAASKKVTLRYFPSLSFELDDTAEKNAHMDSLIRNIQKQREARNES